MAGMDLISIITPVYNAENYIEQTLLMVEQQTYENWELLLVDDASTDSSVDVIRRFLAEKCDDRVRLITSKTNDGPAVSRNKGIDESRGRFISFLDADDIWKPEKLNMNLSLCLTPDLYLRSLRMNLGTKTVSVMAG